MKYSAEEMLESLNGFDEQAIENAFGDTINNLGEKRPTTFLRALYFVGVLRTGKKHAEAKTDAMNATIKDLDKTFSVEDEVMPEEPVTVEGKDDSDQENPLERWPTSAI